MKKVLFVINTMGCAGAEKALIELLKKFPPQQYEVSLFVLLGQGELIHQIPAHVKMLNKNYCDISVLSKEGKKQLRKRILTRMFSHGSVFKNIPYLFQNLFSMIKCGKIYPDKLLWKVMADGAWRTKEHYDLAVAYLEGGSTYYVNQHVHADKKATFLHVDYSRAGYNRKLDQECYLNYNRIFTVSDEVRESFLSEYPECEQKTEVFHNLINQEEIRHKATLPGGFDDEYRGLRILTVGRLTAQKAYETAIDAMKLLKSKGIEARWYVLGEGELRGKLEQQIAQNDLKDHFILLGVKENPYPYYAQTDLYVHATRFEGKSIAIQEAQTLGCTIVVSDCSGNREQVEDGIDGLMCELTPQGICQAIMRLEKNEELRKKLGQKAAEKKISTEDVRKLLSLL